MLPTDQLTKVQKYLASMKPDFSSKEKSESAVKSLYKVLGADREPEIIWLPSPLAFTKSNVFNRVIEDKPLFRWLSFQRVGGKELRLSLLQASLRYRRNEPRLMEHRNLVEHVIDEDGWNGDFQILMRSLFIGDMRTFFRAIAVRESGAASISPRNKEKLVAVEKAFLSCYSCYLGQRYAILVKPPVSIKRDAEGRLHSAKGLAVRYSDGEGSCYWHGVYMPAGVGKYGVVEIQEERNAERRRAMTEIYGMEKFLNDVDADLLDEGELGNLYRVIYDDGSQSNFVQVINSTPEKDGSRKEYVLQVPARMEDADMAVAWTFNMDVDTYKRCMRQQT